MNADTLSYLASNKLYSIIGLVTFCVAFTLILIRVVRMDRKDVETMGNLPLENNTNAGNGDMTNE